MKTYTITTREVIFNYYTAQAESEEQAKDLVMGGGLDTNDIESTGCEIWECTEVA